MYHQFNIQQFYILLYTVYSCVLCGSEIFSRFVESVDFDDLQQSVQ